MTSRLPCQNQEPLLLKPSRAISIRLPLSAARSPLPPTDDASVVAYKQGEPLPCWTHPASDHGAAPNRSKQQPGLTQAVVGHLGAASRFWGRCRGGPRTSCDLRANASVGSRPRRDAPPRRPWRPDAPHGPRSRRRALRSWRSRRCSSLVGLRPRTTPDPPIIDTSRM